MTGATLAVELGCLPGLYSDSESLLCEGFRIACQSTVWGLLISCRGGDEVPASTVERKGPGTLSPVCSSQLHFWSLLLRLCRQRLFYEDRGVEEQVHSLAW